MWYKLPWSSFITTELMRRDAVPFFAGAATVLLMGVYINNTITEEDKKTSKYYKQFVLGDKSGH